MFEVFDEYHTYNGRITRKGYIIRVIGRWFYAALVTIILYGLVMLLSFITFNIGEEAYFLTGLIAAAVFIAAAVYFFFFKLLQEIKRLHDVNLSGWWAIFGFVPFLSIIYYLYLIFVDGTVGPNKFGEDPKGRSGGNN
ncbi:Inner membrane protein YhaI [Methanimicrococcus sp. At1]|uniref:Inner membrane protein YhaI n=1 Tax=Methanimicrococcus hacksteinii TaxID=3028293 RepID=A0ABU3VQD4_9EURY|nr:DUF805 domain-containing protein [Methanimicrococcus sp. At1]MDV0445618.1 Inner membrane protein YhaI [Methanimicrococcus sp. At1]